jgi:hypothetical protein
MYNYTHKDAQNMPWRMEGLRPISMLADIVMKKAPIVMTQWCITFNPSDYPGKYVVREWHIFKGFDQPMPGLVHIAPGDLESARQLVPDDRTMIPRSEHDDPVIVETWV